jgi:hypothetical protein
MLGKSKRRPRLGLHLSRPQKRTFHTTIRSCVKTNLLTGAAFSRLSTQPELVQLKLSKVLEELAEKLDRPVDHVRKAASDYINMLHSWHGFFDADGRPIRPDTGQLHLAKENGNLADPMSVHLQNSRRGLMTKPDQW